MEQQKFSSTMVATVPMQAIGINWPGVKDAIQHAIHLLETKGPTAVATVKVIMVGVQALTKKDYVGVFLALQEVSTDVQTLIDAIKAEFDLAS